MSNTFTSIKVRQIFSFVIHLVFKPQPLRAVGVLFSPMVSGWEGGWGEIVCPGCISETIRCRKFILGRDIGWGVGGGGGTVQCHGLTLI